MAEDFCRIINAECERNGIWKLHCDTCEVHQNEMKKVSDIINHPAHYTQGGIECIDAMVSAFGAEAVKSYCKINAFKYVWRTDHKNGREDIEKAIWYLKKYIELDTDSEKTVTYGDNAVVDTEG